MSLRARDLRIACGLDWGSASPGVCLWACALPNGHVHVFDEVKFQRMTVADVASALKDRHRAWKLSPFPPIYCDPSLKAHTGQIGEDYLQTFARHGLGLTPVSNHRTAGWQRIHEALAVDSATGTPWLTIHPRCKYLIRTLPLMVQAAADPEDLDTETDDHACLLGDTLITTPRGEKPLTDLNVGETVVTRKGPKRVLAVAQTGTTREIWQVVTSTGRLLRGTANHPVFVDGKGFVRLDTLRYNDMLASCLTFHGHIGTLGISGVGLSAPSQPGIISTTKTGTLATTTSRTWNVFRPLNTSVTTGNGIRGHRKYWNALDRLRRCGIALLKGVRGTASTLSESSVLARLLNRVTSAAARFWTDPITARAAFAPITANLNGVGAVEWTTWTASASSAASHFVSADMPAPAPVPAPAVTVVAVFQTKLDESVPVYNLTVEDAHEYYAHGVLTHNCDSLRYLLMGGLRPGSKALFQRTPPGSWGWFKRAYRPQAVA